MGAGWQVVGFPVILPWREEFWTLPLYFPDLRLGVIPDWPSRLPYQGMPLPPEATIQPSDLAHIQPGDLRQWQAFEEYRRSLSETGDIIQAIRTYGQAEPPEPPPAFDIWTLAWQLEKIQADQDARLLLVDKGQKWLGDILQPEPWEEKVSFGVVPGVEEMVDPGLAKLRYRLWRRVMAPYLKNSWVPLLLGRTSRALFLSLKGWPDWASLRKVEISLPGCRSESEWLGVLDQAGGPGWPSKFLDLLRDLLNDAAANSQAILEASQELAKFVEIEILPRWPFQAVWNWDLEIWLPEKGEEMPGPVLCWAGAGEGILPG